MKPHLQRLATAGNTGALMLLMCVLVNAPVLGGGGVPVETPARAVSEAWPSAPSTTVAQQVLFVVVDGLRAEEATRTALMPHLTQLAAEGGRGVARLESLLPSTVAALHTVVTAAVAPPASVLHDFRAPPAVTGGLLAALMASGRQSFVAGPSLWTDLYGRWIAQTATTASGGQDDTMILQAGVAALQPPHYAFVVVHFGSVDEAGHRYGVHAPAYAQAVAWCDVALGQLLAHVGRQTAVLIVADHGATANGGHAGPERSVRDTPLVTWGPGMPRGALGTLRQRDVPALVGHALGLAPMRPPPPPPRYPWARTSQTGVDPVRKTSRCRRNSCQSRGRTMPRRSRVS